MISLAANKNNCADEHDNSKEKPKGKFKLYRVLSSQQFIEHVE